MKYFIACLALVLTIVTDTNEFNLGNWEEAAFDKVRQVLDFSISSVNSLLKDESNYFRLDKLEKAERHIVSGFMYKLKFSLIETKCSKVSAYPTSNLNECDLSASKNILYCDALVLEQKWLSPSTKMIRKPKCSPQYE